MPKKIVVVDDEQDICKLLELALSDQGYEVHSAFDGLAGKDLVNKVNPDLVILDLKMPKLNGYELTLQLKQNPKHKDLPIIVMTSLTEGSSKPDAQWRDSLEVRDFITKPFDTETLIERVEGVIGPA
jgi:DNA-binding response OmpR family regulator